MCTTRGEYWLLASWMMSRETENAMPANVMVAPAMVLGSMPRALSTVDVMPSGSLVFGSSRLSMAIPANPTSDRRQHGGHRDEEQAGPDSLGVHAQAQTDSHFPLLAEDGER